MPAIAMSDDQRIFIHRQQDRARNIQTFISSLFHDGPFSAALRCPRMNTMLLAIFLHHEFLSGGALPQSFH